MRDAVTAGECQFQTAAQTGAVYRGDPGDVALLDPGENIRQVRIQRRTIEFARIGPGGKGAALAGQDHPVQPLGLGPVHSLQQTLPHRPADGIDRRVIQFHQPRGSVNPFRQHVDPLFGAAPDPTDTPYRT